jgi:hypothetical protein
VKNKPVICSIGASVLHSTPLRPGLDGVLRRIPDLLAPDDILESEGSTIVHDPFRDGFSNIGPHLGAVLAILLATGKAD